MMASSRRSEPGSPNHGARSERERPVHRDDHDELPTSSRARRHKILRSDQIAPPRRDPYTAILEEEGDDADSGIDDDGPEREPCWDFDTDSDSEVGEQMSNIRDRNRVRARKQYWKDVKNGKRRHLGDEQKDAAIERIYVEMVKKEAIRSRARSKVQNAHGKQGTERVKDHINIEARLYKVAAKNHRGKARQINVRRACLSVIREYGGRERTRSRRRPHTSPRS